MAGKRKVYTPEFKLLAVKMITEQKLSVAEVARRLRVHEGRLHGWKKALAAGGAGAFPGSGRPAPLEEENRRLRAEVRRLSEERDILKSHGVLRRPLEVTFAWVEERRSEWPITVLCRALGVSRSGYYAWLTRKPSAAEVRRGELAEEVRAIHAQAKARYGSPRVHAELVARGHECCVNTVARVMRAAGIAAKTKRGFRRTTDSGHALPVAGNVLDRDFAPAEPGAAWVADITYIPTREGWLYLAVVVDLFSRRVVGWSMAGAMTSRLAVDALEMALASRPREPSGLGLIAHSDRGSQYASEHHRRVLAGAGIVCSMSRRGNCWDNAPAKSFFATLKKELVHHEDYATRSEAKASIFEYIEVFYNRARRHSTLGYVAPDEYERAYNRTHR